MIFYPDELYHHGVKGQKWGVRHYQNADGSLTPEGREHYGIGKGNKLLNKSPSDMTLDDFKSLEKSKDILVPYAIKKEDKQRANEVATIGLKALNTARNEDYEINAANKSWFAWEDQTLGCFTIADLARSGKSSKYIQELKDKAEQIYYNGNDDGRSQVVFDLAEYNKGIGYIEECVKEAQKLREKSVKHSDLEV